jgi:L-proline amide hydrolase
LWPPACGSLRGVTDEFLQWDAGRTWYRVVGDLGEPGLAPLVLLHGGPGVAHDYLETLSVLAERTGRACVFYDQLGCGLSEHLPDAPPEMWTVELFRRELAALLDHLQIASRYHLLGQSWGGMLAMEHAVGRPSGLASMVVANSPASMRLWVTEANRLRGMLPAAVQEALTRHELAGTTDSDEYQQAMIAFYERHVCRVVPFPPALTRSLAQLEADPTVYHTMNGPSEFHVIGTLTDWDITSRLGDIEVPVLVISGEHDEATPAVVTPLVNALSDGTWELIAGASHSTHLEEPERFLDLVSTFLAAHD